VSEIGYRNNHKNNVFEDVYNMEVVSTIKMAMHLYDDNNPQHDISDDIMKELVPDSTDSNSILYEGEFLKFCDELGINKYFSKQELKSFLERIGKQPGSDFNYQRRKGDKSYTVDSVSRSIRKLDCK
jgi:hypothetical protein